MIIKKYASLYSKNSYQCSELISYLILRNALGKMFYLNTNEKSEIDGYCFENGKIFLIENKIRISESLDRYETSICETKKIDKILNSNYIKHKEVWIFTYYKDGVLMDKINDLKENKYLIFKTINSYLENFGDKTYVERDNYIFKTYSQKKQKIDLSYYIDLCKKYCYECNGNLDNKIFRNLIIETIDS